MMQHSGSARRDHTPARSGGTNFDRTGSDETLLWLLKRAGDSWGAARVAAVAAALVGSDRDGSDKPRVPTGASGWVKTYHPEKRRQYRA